MIKKILNAKYLADVLIMIIIFQGGSGYVRRITFEQITLNAAGSPIIIDQHYCDGKKEGCPDQVN